MDTIFSIVMPTYNSEKTIRYSLDSIAAQAYDLKKVECLIIDGGSSDKTLAIAAEYPFVTILKNEKRLPEYAKFIGSQQVKGKYIIFMDSDEAFSNDHALALREQAFGQFPQAQLLVANQLYYVASDEGGVAGNYINACGDPFSFFIYRPKKSILETYPAHIVKKAEHHICLLNFSNCAKRPIADGGTKTFSASFLKKQNPAAIDVAFISSVGDKILDENGNCLCIADDNVAHRSKSKLLPYLKKIRFRIINNTFQKEMSGFSSRAVSGSRKQFLFPLYTASFILPLCDAVTLSVRYKDIFMLLHIFYCYYTCILIAWYQLLKLLKINKQNKEY